MLFHVSSVGVPTGNYRYICNYRSTGTYRCIVYQIFIPIVIDKSKIIELLVVTSIPVFLTTGIFNYRYLEIPVSHFFENLFSVYRKYRHLQLNPFFFLQNINLIKIVKYPYLMAQNYTPSHPINNMTLCPVARLNDRIYVGRQSARPRKYLSMATDFPYIYKMF